MRKGGAIWRPDLASKEDRDALPVRIEPYYSLLSYGRHLGLQKQPWGTSWVARTRTRAGAYRRKRLGALAGETGEEPGLTYKQACAAALAWFGQSGVRDHASDERPIGTRRELIICPCGEEFTVAHAMHDYVEWKRLTAAKSHFETNLSLINFHIVPRLANVRLADFNGENLRAFIKQVLETRPRRGNRGPDLEPMPIDRIEPDALRKRKKTVNTLIGILRVAFQMAWENSKIDNDRAWRCLRRIPAVDRPRVMHLSRSECRDLLSACRPDLRRLVLGALYTGCRMTELVRMRCSQVGRDGYGVYIEPLKTYRPRFVFLPDEGMYWFLQLIQGRKPSDLVFMRDNRKPWFGNQKHLFKAAVREVGLPDEFSFHGLRHTYASQLIQAGATVYAVAEQLGHADPTTVLRTYGHLSPQIRESEVRQRFTTVDAANAAAASERGEELTAWRSALHGADWRTYATISEVANPEVGLLPHASARANWVAGTQVAKRRRH